MEFLFIVGSPRSGTTILGEILDTHRSICQWYEPYFIWDRHFREAPDDVRSEENATPAVADFISRHFRRYGNRRNCRFVVDKSPRNSLKIPFVGKVFPEARFIHILRDGRDVTLSIHKEWQRRFGIFGGKAGNGKIDYKKSMEVIRTWMKRQPFVEDRVRAFWFETHGHLFDKQKHLNRLRWNGQVGWGPRFRGWEEEYVSRTTLEFNAMQWTRCVESIGANWPMIPEERKLLVRYEDLVDNYRETVKKILNFIGAEDDPEFLRRLPAIKKGNFNKWKNEFTREQLQSIQPILSPLLDTLGYSRRFPW